MYGGRLSLVLGIFGPLIAALMGTVIGTASGYFGGCSIAGWCAPPTS